MRKKALSFTLEEESHRFIESIAEEIGESKSYVVDLLIDAAAGNLGILNILQHYNIVFKHNRSDGRKNRLVKEDAVH